MKIAVIGGNLLGCATVMHLALVDESNTTPNDSSDSFEITLFERKDCLGGNSLKSVRIDDRLRVEVGTYRTLSIVPGTHLSFLIDLVNNQHGKISVFGRHISIPGSKAALRGEQNSVPVRSLWESGSHKRLVRSFSAWNWRADTYDLKHSGWSLLDFVHRILNNGIWRSIALAGLISAYRTLQATDGTINRSMGVIQVLLMLLLVVVGPSNVVAQWQRQYSFWGTTLPLMWQYGVTPAVLRGSTLGFTSHLSSLHAKGAVKYSATFGALIQRCEFEPYLRATGDDLTRMFKYNTKFIDRTVAPVVAIHNEGSAMTQVSSLATQFAMLSGDYMNSDAPSRLSSLVPHNANLCTALISSAQKTTNVDVQFNANVNNISFDTENNIYHVTLADGCVGEFDGIVLCASPTGGELNIETRGDLEFLELLGYRQNSETARAFAEQDAKFRLKNNVVVEPSPVDSSACSHFAVVVGPPKPSFFRFAHEKYIPDLVQISHAPGLSQFERIRESTNEESGVYTVLCGDDFESGGLFGEMFEPEAELKYFEPLSKRSFLPTAFPEGKEVDDCTPPIVLGPRFVFAAALESLAKHPEVDAIAASNAASLFSKSIQWTGQEHEDT